ncbi:Uncharacterised protein [Mycobacteroides abscessus subsp. abscessus]|nr:Uncharacterised protein [Mycobacteroides abscessus subsp. abscessus]
MSSASSVEVLPRSSERATSMAPAARSRPIFSLSSTALIATESMNSSIDGRICAVIAKTASVASCTDEKVATTVHGVGWEGSRRRVTSVITPSVPSLPTNNLVRLKPATSFRRGPPSLRTVPSASTTCMPST